MEPESNTNLSNEDALPSPRWLRLAKYLWGGLTATERADVERWFEANPRRAADVTEFEQAWAEPMESADDEARVHHALARVSQRAGFALDTAPLTAIPARQGRQVRTGDRRITRLPAIRTTPFSGARYVWRFAAAGVVGAMALVVGVRWMRRQVPPTPARSYATAAGQRETVTLPDSSRVTLAPQTTLLVSAGFGHTNRVVTLRGHAYFDVSHTAGLPFAVHTGQVVTRVLGTAFDIMHYADDRDVRVVVASGKVAVTTPRRAAVTLVPNMIGRVTDSTTFVSSIGDAASYSAWTQGTLEFHDVPVREVLRTMSRWYGVQFELADTTLAAHRITTFLNSTDVRDATTALETLLDVSATSRTTSAGLVVTLRARMQTVRPARRRDTQTFSPNSEVGR